MHILVNSPALIKSAVMMVIYFANEAIGKMGIRYWFFCCVYYELSYKRHIAVRIFTNGFIELRRMLPG